MLVWNLLASRLPARLHVAFIAYADRVGTREINTTMGGGRNPAGKQVSKQAANVAPPHRSTRSTRLWSSISQGPGILERNSRTGGNLTGWAGGAGRRERRHLPADEVMMGRLVDIEMSPSVGMGSGGVVWEESGGIIIESIDGDAEAIDVRQHY